MSKLVYGKIGQVRFHSEQEKREAFDYLRNSPNVVHVHEDNQEQGAWAPEERIHFKTLVGVPEGLRRNMTEGRGGSVAGRINCKELIEEVWGASRSSARPRPARSTPPQGGICCQMRAPIGSECVACGNPVR